MLLVKKPLVVFLPVTLWLILEYFILGPYSYVRIFDVGNIHIPQNIVAAADFWRWGATYWYPYSLGGIDLMAEGYRALNLNYMNVFYYFLPAWMAYPAFLLGVVWTGGYFTYRLAREHLGLSEAGGYFAGVSLACVLGVWALCFVALLPLVLFAFDKIHEKSRRSLWHGLWVFPLALLFASGSQFVFDHMALLIIPAWFILVLRKWDRRFWLLYGLFVVTALLYYFPTLWAQFANGPYSHRADDPMTLGYHLGVVTGMLLMIHDQTPAHMALPLLWTLGIVAALWKFRFHNGKFNGVLALFCLLAGAAYLLNIFAFLVQDKIAFFRGIHFHYTLLPLPVFYALAGAFAVEALRAPPRPLLVRFLFVLLFVFSLYPKALNLNRWLHGDHYAHLYGNPVLQRLAGQMTKDNLFRVGGTHWITPPILSAYGLETVGGYVHLYPKRYKLFFSALLGRGEGDWVGSRAHLWGDRLNGSLLSLANTKFIVSERETPKPEGFSAKLQWALNRVVHNFEPHDRYAIVENRDVLPRFFVARSPKYFDAPEDLFHALKNATDASLFKEAVFLEREFQADVPFHQGNFQFANIQVEEYSPDRIRLTVEVDGEGVLIVSNSYSPFWRVFLDGVERKILPAYLAFWGVPLTKGNHEIRFSYEPPYRFF
ncbi:MAG: YfhO family protein [Deltaproteobacteria bacterium]|nr:YfhO family protein [Deltaproteobacteria bacterium]MBI4224097.1 YfhO family protein [Deltaproteobacteria bacterium]